VNTVALTRISSLGEFLHKIPGKKLLILIKERLKHTEFLLLVFPFKPDIFLFISKFYRFVEYYQNFYSDSDNAFKL